MKKPSSVKQLRGKYTKIDIPFFGATNLFGTVYSHDKKLIEKLNSERCYGVVANEDVVLVCEYGCNGSNPEIVLYKRR